MKVFIVESPGKVKKIQSYLGQGWKVVASCGHVRQLSKRGEGKLGFSFRESRNGKKDIKCDYEEDKEKLSSIRKVLTKASEVYIATDGDREGETIGWHIVDALKIEKYRRAIYREITEKAIRESVAQAGELNLHLVNAGRCRDCLDKLIGYRLSPRVWDLGAKSVGRVQTPTLHFLCERELEIQNFKSHPYWVLEAIYRNGIKAVLERKEGPFLKEEEALKVRDLAQRLVHRVKEVKTERTKKNPPAALTTSTLQQAAGARLSFPPEKTMKIAQRLYEKGYITYMRTDSTMLSQEFIEQAKEYCRQQGIQEATPESYKGRKSKNAQEAHEAIRPTKLGNVPEEAEERALYLLIEQRTLASLCRPAVIERTLVLIDSEGLRWVARGQRVLEKGYTIFWNDIDADKQLPKVEEGERLNLEKIEVRKEKTQPPKRYTEATVVERMEKLGIGRPSTYAATVAILKERGYIEVREKGMVYVTPLGLKVDAYMSRLFPKLVSPEFTKEMEEELDEIATGNKDWADYLWSIKDELEKLELKET